MNKILLLLFGLYFDMTIGTWELHINLEGILIIIFMDKVVHLNMRFNYQAESDRNEYY